MTLKRILIESLSQLPRLLRKLFHVRVNVMRRMLPQANLAEELKLNVVEGVDVVAVTQEMTMVCQLTLPAFEVFQVTSRPVWVSCLPSLTVSVSRFP